MLTQYNKWLERAAVEPEHRRMAIAKFTQQRAILFCCAVVITGCAAVEFFATPNAPRGPMLGSLAAFLSWLGVIRISSDLRVLKLLERFSIPNAKPEA